MNVKLNPLLFKIIYKDGLILRMFFGNIKKVCLNNQKKEEDLIW